MQTEDLTCASPKVVVRSNDHTIKQRCSWHPISLHQIIDAGIIVVLVALVIFLMIWLSYPHIMNCFILIGQLTSLPLDKFDHLLTLGPTVVERSWSIWPFPSLPIPHIASFGTTDFIYSFKCFFLVLGSSCPALNTVFLIGAVLISFPSTFLPTLQLSLF